MVVESWLFPHYYSGTTLLCNVNFVNYCVCKQTDCSMWHAFICITIRSRFVECETSPPLLRISDAAPCDESHVVCFMKGVTVTWPIEGTGLPNWWNRIGSVMEQDWFRRSVMKPDWPIDGNGLVQYSVGTNKSCFVFVFFNLRTKPFSNLWNGHGLVPVC